MAHAANHFTLCNVSNRAQVATQLKELVQQQHQQLRQYRWGGQAAPHSHKSLPGLEGMHAGSGQGDEMSELRALIQSLRYAIHHGQPDELVLYRDDDNMAAAKMICVVRQNGDS